MILPNIGTGKGVSVLELINTFEKATGVKLNYQIVARDGDKAVGIRKKMEKIKKCVVTDHSSLQISAEMRM